MANPIPSLPDLERRTSYPIANASGPFDVGFDLYGSGTDYDAWLEVWLNGEKLVAGTQWFLTSPSGPIANLVRPIRDAVVTLAAAGTGDLQIIGAFRPRRTSQLTENRGVSARDFNQIVTTIIAAMREMRDQSSRMLGVPPGETLGMLPGASDRALFSLGFDAEGRLTLQALPSGYPASPFMGDVLGAPDAETVRELLDITVSPDAGSTVAFVNWQNFR
ncbi:hypothetical protein [Afipia carboxidovorans]|uniref:hypothetical protein n=1 Tax=Afipia carboxidovorans TaxID=40137 RepID=UPI00308ED339|nr:hypothetical protein CRBSH125_06090 [Afipia carboxidovorans]